MFADKIRALGYQLTIPPDAEDQDLETALDEFLFSEPPDFEGKFISMDEDETIKWGKRPTEKQLRAIGNEWLRQMLLPSGGEDFEEIVLRICPRIRA